MFAKLVSSISNMTIKTDFPKNIFIRIIRIILPITTIKSINRIIIGEGKQAQKGLHTLNQKRSG